MSSDTRQWQHRFASLYHQAVPAHLLERLQQEANAIAQCDNFWISRADLESRSTTTTAESAISCLLDGILHDKLPNAWAGAEWWVQVYKPGKGLAFHFDKDEHAMKEKQQMIQPVLSSVLYLTGGSTQERLGPTAVIDQLFDAEQGKAVPDSPERTALVFPFKNQYMLFDGRLGHGVLGSSSKQPRMTMLVNWWAEKPQDINRITDEVIQQHSLSNLSPDSQASPSAQAAPSSNTADGAGDVPARIQQLNSASQQSPHSATAPSPALHTAPASSTLPDKTAEEEASVASVAPQHQHPSSRMPASSQQQQQQQQPEDAEVNPHGCAAGSAEASSAGHQSHGKLGDESDPKQLGVPCVSIAGWEESPVSVDDVLQTYGLALTGPKAVHAVAIDHRGFELFPLDEENLEANAGSIATAAAFVPAGLVSDQSESSSESEE